MVPSIITFLLLAIDVFLHTNFFLPVAVTAQRITKDVIHFCQPHQLESCGPWGQCVVKTSGNRCICPSGYMGRQCARPCQDIYKSCDRWKDENRCYWTKKISPFFSDNCAATCDICRQSIRKLAVPLPPILEPLAWIVGRWETETTAPDRFPMQMTGPYRETLDIQIAAVPQFDRPPLNVTVTAISLDGHDHHIEVGFITAKPFLEDTGFVEYNKPLVGDDRAAMELNSNSGLHTIEEGLMRGTEFRLEVTYKYSFFGQNDQRTFRSVQRSFRLVGNTRQLEERVSMVTGNGAIRRWAKRYWKTRDYLSEF